jgi:hypothetical protein
MATLSELRTLVRTQTETTEAELPNSTLDWYIRQGFERTVAAESTWPSYENSWNLTLTAGEMTMEIPVDCNQVAITSLVDVESGLRLNMLDQETAEDLYLRDIPAYTFPFEFSMWGGIFHLWPQVDWTVDRTYVLRGNRYSTDWIAAGADSTVDADYRLHYPLVHFAVALAYAQQEATELEDVYMGRWQRDVDAARAAIMEPSRQQPMTFGGGKRDFRHISRRWNINTPI